MAGALQLTGICPVAVQVRGLERSLAFYRDVLGLRLGHREGRIAQLHGQGDAPPGARPARVAGPCPAGREPAAPGMYTYE
ncbi:MAG: VOC family protein [Streptosporangiaceae bacterium]